MLLSPEVQASIISVASDWAMAITDKEYELAEQPEWVYYLESLKDNFEESYKALKDIISREQN